MPSKRAYVLRDLILNGQIDAAALQTALATPETLADFQVIANSTYSFEPIANSSAGFEAVTGSAIARGIISNSSAAIRAMANSRYATEQLVKTANGALLFADFLNDVSGLKFSHWRDFDSNYHLLKTLVNASGSKLKRQVFTSSGTWSLPVGVLAVSATIGAAGGSGYRLNAGGGGEIRTVNFSGAIPDSDQTVTIGSAGNATSFGATSSTQASSGGGLSGLGGGTTTNGGKESFTDVFIEEAVFQARTASQKGGDGGNSFNSYIAEDGITPNSAGRGGYGTGVAASPGQKYGAGGGGGPAASPNPPIPSNAPANSCSGGASRRVDTNIDGGTGGSGIVVVHWLEA